ncbi:hypothetical protein ABT160_29200 [Streptomyces sp. NPDC001941]|uniref:hypothetical protein n=1 Tax=Streptomyces sp. NPDC001941 TaxID=3154659 RepID=UPI0033324074
MEEQSPLTPRQVSRRLLWSLIAWWGALSLVFWLLDFARDHSASLLACAGSAALLVALGEIGDGVRRWHKRRRGVRTAARPGG